MDKIERMFFVLKGRKATVEELNDLRRLKDTIRPADNDALWPIVIQFRSQLTDTAVLQRKIEQTADEAVKTIYDAVTQAVKATKEAALAEQHMKLKRDDDEFTLPTISTALIVVGLLGWGLFELYAWGRADAIEMVRVYDPQLAARIFDAPECGP